VFPLRSRLGEPQNAPRSDVAREASAWEDLLSDPLNARLESGMTQR
jgi:hypothetical protein